LNFVRIDPFMMMTSFLTFSGVSILTKKMGGAANTRMHGYLMFVAGGTAIFGGYVIWSNKEIYGKPHLTTPHGQFGALTLTGFATYPLIAWISYNPDNGYLKSNQLARKFHKYSGRLTVLMGLVTSAFGILSLEKDVYVAGGLIATLFAATPFLLL
jgi:Eukaryotic cytochrome b561